MGNEGTGVCGTWGATWAMGHRGRGMGHMGNRGTGGMGYKGYGQWGTGCMGHMGNGVLGVWGIWAIRPPGGMGYRGMGHMGNRGYGVQGVWGIRGMGHVGNAIHGQWGSGIWATWAMGPMGDLLPKYQKDVKLSKRCQVVKKMSSCQKDVKCQKIKHLDYGGVLQKNYIDTMRFTDIDINFDVTNDGH